jgi:DNA invertase Pin-like site-specific DNA recombinase
VRLDRLARSTRDLLNILDDVAHRGAGFKSLHDAWADTTSAHGRLMVTILAGLAEFERELILARTSDGRARAKARGVRFGRPVPMAKCRLISPVPGVSQATISRCKRDAASTYDRQGRCDARGATASLIILI